MQTTEPLLVLTIRVFYKYIYSDLIRTQYLEWELINPSSDKSRQITINHHHHHRHRHRLTVIQLEHRTYLVGLTTQTGGVTRIKHIGNTTPIVSLWSNWILFYHLTLTHINIFCNRINRTNINHNTNTGNVTPIDNGGISRVTLK